MFFSCFRDDASRAFSEEVFFFYFGSTPAEFLTRGSHYLRGVCQLKSSDSASGLRIIGFENFENLFPGGVTKARLGEWQLYSKFGACFDFSFVSLIAETCIQNNVIERELLYV